MKKKDFLKVQLLLPDDNISQFMYNLSSQLGKNIQIESLLPSDEKDDIIRFTCEVSPNKFKDFETIYEKFYKRPFSLAFKN